MKKFDLKDLSLIIPIGLLLIIQIPNLSLPYFWDEAWSYFPAIYKMYEIGPGLLPGDLPLWDAKEFKNFDIRFKVPAILSDGQW